MGSLRWKLFGGLARRQRVLHRYWRIQAARLATDGGRGTLIHSGCELSSDLALLFAELLSGLAGERRCCIAARSARSTVR